MWEESFRITTKEEITLFRGKKYKDSAKLVDRSTQYEVPAAMDLVVKTASAQPQGRHGYPRCRQGCQRG